MKVWKIQGHHLYFLITKNKKKEKNQNRSAENVNRKNTNQLHLKFQAKLHRKTRERNVLFILKKS